MLRPNYFIPDLSLSDFFIDFWRIIGSDIALQDVNNCVHGRKGIIRVFGIVFERCVTDQTWNRLATKNKHLPGLDIHSGLSAEKMFARIIHG